MRHMILVMAAVLSLASMPALASDCAPEVQKIDQQFVSTNPLPPNTMAEAKRLRDEGLALCEGGSIERGLDVLAQAKALLGIE